jgi:curved DNA-binding protein CbpA
MSDFIDYNELSKINLYDLLNISENSMFDDIRRSFKKIASKLHPDKNPNQNMEDKDLFENIQVAYFILSEENRRKKYDEMRKQHQDMFYSLKNQSQKKNIENPNKNEFDNKVKELEKEHLNGVNYEDIKTDTRLKKFQIERSNFNFPKPRINEFKDRVNGQKFNDLFNKEIEENKSYDIVEYKGDSITPVGNYITLDNFEKLYVSSSNGRVFNNNFSTLDEAYNSKYIKVDNNYNTHNIRDKEYTRNLNKKVDIYRRDFFMKK